MTNRTQIRQQMRKRRNELSLQQRLDAAINVERHIASTRAFRNSRRIACYISNDNEVELEPLIEQIWTLNKQCYLPILDTIHHNRLWFAPYRPDSEMYTNRFGILEPRYNKRELIRAQALDLVLMPLVAFDRQGNRLGMGGGFYDRSLAFLRHRNQWRKPRLYGIAYQFQCLKQLPIEHWDVPLDAIASDEGIYKRAKSSSP